MSQSINSILQKTYITERLKLVHLNLEDAPFIFELTNSKGWLSFIGDRNIQSLADAKGYINKINDNPNVKYWKIEEGEQTTPIGLITLIKRDYLEDYDIGFALLPQFTGKGYAFEGSHIVLKELMQNAAIQQIVAITQINNAQSIRLLEKLGLQYNRTMQDNGTDLQVYGITKEQFLAAEGKR